MFKYVKIKKKDLMIMKKVRICQALIILVVFIVSMDFVHAFEIETIMTTSDVVDGKPQGEKIYFEPGDIVYIYVDTGPYSGGHIMKIDVGLTVYGPSDQIIFESFDDDPSSDICEHERCRCIYSRCFCLSPQDPIGEYTVRVTVYDRSDNTQKTAESTFYVDTIHKFLEEANSYLKIDDYEKARTYYEKAKKQYEWLAVIDKTGYCREKMEECEKYIQAMDHYSKADTYLKEKDYENAVDYFWKARDLYAELEDEELVQMCNKYIQATNYYLKAEKYLEEKDYWNAVYYFRKARDLYAEVEDEGLALNCNDPIVKCDKCLRATDYYSTAEIYLKEKDYRKAADNFMKARDLYAEVEDEDLVQICNSQIKECTGIRFFIKEFPKIPSIANLSVITSVICAYILLKQFRGDKKNKILVVFPSIAIVISSILSIRFYLHEFFYVTLLLVASVSGALALKIVPRKVKREAYPNPYIAGNPIRSKEIFFGRKDVFQFIKNKLSAKKNITIVLYGERRTGKTSVLYQIENGELGKEFVPVYTDIQEMAKVYETEFFIKITEKIAESLTRNEIIDLKSSEYSEITELLIEYKNKTNPYQTFNKFLDIISNLLREKYLILLFDEYEILEKKIKEGHLSADLIHYLRNQMQSREKFSFIFAGSRKLEELEGKHWSLMFNAATYKRISFLNKEDALDLMTIPIRNRIHYNDEAIDKILRLTACHPYFLQLFLQNLVDHLNDIKKNNVTIEEVEYILHYLLDNPSPHMIYIWQDSTSEQRLILSALSEIIESEKEYITARKIKETLLANNITLDADTTKKALIELHKKEILDYEENNYNFKVDLLRYWIKIEHPLFKTVGDIQ